MTAENVQNANRALVFNTGVYCEGEVKVLPDYMNVQLDGKGIYIEHDLKFKFKGTMKEDNLVQGLLTSSYAKLEGEFDDFIFKTGTAELHFCDGYSFFGKFRDKKAEGLGHLVTPENHILEGVWENGRWEDWVILHGDINKRFHRLCLLDLKPRLEKGSKRIRLGVPDGMSLIKYTAASDETPFVLRTLMIYDKKFSMRDFNLNTTKHGSLQLVSQISKLETFILNYSLFRYEKIGNDETYGVKEIDEVIFNFKEEGYWKVNGCFSSKEYKITKFDINFKNIMKIRVDKIYKD